MAENEKWQWQEPGTAWKGVGLYHVTLTVPSREPLLGRLVIPGDDPSMARIDRTPLGNAVVDELYVMCRHYPAIRILQFCLMPDHLHAVIYMTRAMDTSISSVIRGYWQGVKKLGRAYTLAAAAEGGKKLGRAATSSVAAELNSATNNKESANAATSNGGGYPFPVFTERPFIRPLSRRGQLNTMIRYVQMNPQRLATKRLKPGLFRVQKDIEIGGRLYDGVGNTTLLMGEHFMPVHVRHELLDKAARGDNQPLRDYMNGCVLAARQGTVMVSPFISQKEKDVQAVLLAEKHPFIVLADNGFREDYKPTDALFEACASGRVLILSPWPYDANKRHISRADCVALNALAEEICLTLSNTVIR